MLSLIHISALPGQKKELEAVQADVKVLRDVRHWLNQVLRSEQYRQTAEPGKKPSVQESLKGRQERIRQEQTEKQKPPRTQKQQDIDVYKRQQKCSIIQVVHR